MATKGTKVPALKNIPAKTDPELRATLNSMKEAQEVRLGRRGDPRDRAITLRELIDSGLAIELRNNPFDPNAGVGALDFIPNVPGGNLAVPPAPTGLEASGAFTEIIVSWNDAQYGNHAYTEVWRSRNDDIGGATLVTTTNSFIITDVVGYNQEYYYWVRFVSTSDVAGPFNKTNGVKATTLEDIAAVMEQLSEELSNLPGYTALTTLITNGDVATAATANLAARVIRSTSAPTTRADGSALVQSDVWIDTDDNNQMYIRNASNNGWEEARDGTLVTLVNSINTQQGTNTTNIASATSDIITLTTANSSRASEITALESTINNSSTGLAAAHSAISTEATTRATADTALATDITNLTSTVGSNTSAISTEQTTRANADTALATDITNLTSTVGTNTSAIATEATTRANADTALSTLITNLTSTVSGNTSAISTEATTRANADSANATSISNLSSTVGTTNSNVSTLQTSVSNLEGDADAMFVIQVATESNGSKSAAGMVIGSNASSGSGAQSYVQFQADKFAVWSGSASIAPFIISGGVVYIDDARIKDGAITNARIQDATIQSAKIGNAQIVEAKIGTAAITEAKIANLAVTNAKINDLSATKITADLLDSARINVNTLNVKHFDNVSTDIKSHTGAFVPLGVEANVQSWSGTYPGQTIISSESSSIVNIACQTANIRNNSKYRVVYSAVLGNVRNGTIQYSFNNSSWVSLSPKVNANAGTFRTYVFIWDGQITGMSSSQSTVYWRITWNVSGGQVNSTYQALYVTMDNTQ